MMVVTSRKVTVTEAAALRITARDFVSVLVTTEEYLMVAMAAPVIGNVRRRHADRNRMKNFSFPTLHCRSISSSLAVATQDHHTIIRFQLNQQQVLSKPSTSSTLTRRMSEGRLSIDRSDMMRERTRVQEFKAIEYWGGGGVKERKLSGGRPAAKPERRRAKATFYEAKVTSPW
nr:hypothetical protein Iba_chr02dCG8310 [Ipomoea batatas]